MAGTGGGRADFLELRTLRRDVRGGVGDTDGAFLTRFFRRGGRPALMFSSALAAEAATAEGAEGASEKDRVDSCSTRSTGPSAAICLSSCMAVSPASLPVVDVLSVWLLPMAEPAAEIELVSTP